MSNPPEHTAEAQTAGRYQAGGGLVVVQVPDEVGVPLRHDDFLTLCEGGTSQARASRDVCIGISCTAAAGLIGVLAAIDWDTISKAGLLKIIVLIALVVALLAATSGAIVGAFVHNSRMTRSMNDSPYSRLKARLLKQYQAQGGVQSTTEGLERLEELHALSPGVRD